MTRAAPGPAPGGPTAGPVSRLIAACARERWLTLVVVAGLAAWGWWALHRVSLDAIPDLSDTQVIVMTEWPGRAPDLVEDQVTYPLSSLLVSAPKVRSVRGQSMFGVSFVYVIFEDGTDMYWARARVVEYLNGAQAQLPKRATPTLGPDASAVGWVFQYALVDRTGAHDLMALRSLQDWNLRYALESVDGVAEVASIGGVVKRYDVNLDPHRLFHFGLSVGDVVEAIRQSNREDGGQVLELAGHEHMVRARGYLSGAADIASVPLKVGDGGVPLTIADVAEVTVGPDSRRGLAELDGDGEVAGAIVVMRHGENALTVIDAVKERLAEVAKGLPDGVEVVVTYDRSELISGAVATLRRTLFEEMLVVSLVIVVMLLHVPSALVPIVTLPLGVLLAFVPMFYQGLGANIMSLGGIAVAIGAMVDASVVFIENVHKRLEAWQAGGRNGDRAQVMVAAMCEVGPTIFFSLLVITVSFIPVFTLEGAEGRLFRPLAFTKTWSMLFAALLAVTATPALAMLLIRGRVRGEARNPLNRWLVDEYARVVAWVVDHRYGVIVGAAVVVLASLPLWLSLGREFMPPLNEGAILYMPTSPPGISVTEAQRVLQLMDRELKQVPEVARVFGKIGRARTATDPAPLAMAETTVLLKPRAEWRPGLDWDGLIDELDSKLRYPGMPNVWWMPIQTRTEMLATGIRSPLGVKLYGDDLATLERAALDIERVLQEVPGTRAAFAERFTGGFYLDVAIDRIRAGRYGVRAKDLGDTVRLAIGGMPVTETIEGRARYPVSVRYAREYRDDPDELARVLVRAPTGDQVPLGELADIGFSGGAPMIQSEAGRLLGLVFVDPGERPVADYVEDAERAIAASVELPDGVRLKWAGQYRYYERARDRLEVLVPVTLLLVCLLLYVNTRSLVETGIVLLAVPFSLVGAVWLLAALGYNLSVAVWVGIIALAGLDAETGVVMLLYLKLAHKRRSEADGIRDFDDLKEAVIDGAANRIRPKLMTVVTTMLGLMPLLWSSGPGADVMKRIAAPMVGGLVTSFVLELTVYPALFAVWKGRRLAEGVPKG